MNAGQQVDPGAWVDRHGDCLYRFAMLRVGTPELAADIVQETFVEAIGSMAAFEGRSSERTWLVGILKHKIADHFRRSRRSKESALDPEGPALGDFDRRGRWRVAPSAWSGDPSREVESREFWEVLGGCLARLPRTLSEAFLLREMEGLDPEEVRQQLDITPANLWARLHRSRSLLRRCLEENWFGGGTTMARPARVAKGHPRP